MFFEAMFCRVYDAKLFAHNLKRTFSIVKCKLFNYDAN